MHLFSFFTSLHVRTILNQFSMRWEVVHVSPILVFAFRHLEKKGKRCLSSKYVARENLPLRKRETILGLAMVLPMLVQ